MEDYRCIHVTKILHNDCKIDSLIMHEFLAVSVIKVYFDTYMYDTANSFQRYNFPFRKCAALITEPLVV